MEVELFQLCGNAAVILKSLFGDEPDIRLHPDIKAVEDSSVHIENNSGDFAEVFYHHINFTCKACR